MGGLPREHGGSLGVQGTLSSRSGGETTCVGISKGMFVLWSAGLINSACGLLVPRGCWERGVGRPGREDGSGRVPAFQTAECRQVCEARVTLLRRLGPRSTDPLD